MCVLHFLCPHNLSSSSSSSLLVLNSEEDRLPYIMSCSCDVSLGIPLFASESSYKDVLFFALIVENIWTEVGISARADEKSA